MRIRFQADADLNQIIDAAVAAEASRQRAKSARRL